MTVRKQTRKVCSRVLVIAVTMSFSIFADHGCVAALDCHFTQDPVASLGTSHGSEWLGLMET